VIIAKKPPNLRKRGARIQGRLGQGTATAEGRCSAGRAPFQGVCLPVAPAR